LTPDVEIGKMGHVEPCDRKLLENVISRVSGEIVSVMLATLLAGFHLSFASAVFQLG